MEMERVYFTGITNGGCCIQGAMVVVRKDCGMAELVRAIKNDGYKMFMLDTMRRFATV